MQSRSTRQRGLLSGMQKGIYDEKKTKQIISVIKIRVIRGLDTLKQLQILTQNIQGEIRLWTNTN